MSQNVTLQAKFRWPGFGDIVHIFPATATAMMAGTSENDPTRPDQGGRTPIGVYASLQSFAFTPLLVAMRFRQVEGR